MTRCPAGIDLVEKLEVKWQSLVSTRIIAVRTRQAGLMEPILQWLMGLFSVKCALVTLAPAVIIPLTSMFVTVELSTFTNLSRHLIVIYATVGMDYHKHQNVTTIHSLTSPTEQGHTAMLGCVIKHSPWAGTDSVETLEVKSLIHVSTMVIVERGRLAGSMEHTQQWLMGLFNVKSVSIEVLEIAVIIQLTSVCVTVVRFTFINLTDPMFVTYVTVATDLYLQHQLMSRDTTQAPPVFLFNGGELFFQLIKMELYRII